MGHLLVVGLAFLGMLHGSCILLHGLWTDLRYGLGAHRPCLIDAETS
jgi:hypothetical protein